MESNQHADDARTVEVTGSGVPQTDIVRWRVLDKLVQKGDGGAVARILCQSPEGPNAAEYAYWAKLCLPAFPQAAHLLADCALEVDVTLPAALIAKAHACLSSGDTSAAAHHYGMAKGIEPSIWDPAFEGQAPQQAPSLPAEEFGSASSPPISLPSPPPLPEANPVPPVAEVVEYPAIEPNYDSAAEEFHQVPQPPIEEVAAGVETQSLVGSQEEEVVEELTDPILPSENHSPDPEIVEAIESVEAETAEVDWEQELAEATAEQEELPEALQAFDEGSEDEVIEELPAGGDITGDFADTAAPVGAGPERPKHHLTLPAPSLHNHQI